MHTRLPPTVRPARAALLLALASLILLPACARLKAKFAAESPLEAFVAPERPNDSCNSAPYRRYLGKTALEMGDLVFAGPVRWLHGGEAPGGDYDPVRLNIEVDVAGMVSRVWCG